MSLSTGQIAAAVRGQDIRITALRLGSRHVDLGGVADDVDIA